MCKCCEILSKPDKWWYGHQRISTMTTELASCWCLFWRLIDTDSVMSVSIAHYLALCSDDLHDRHVTPVNLVIYCAEVQHGSVSISHKCICVYMIYYVYPGHSTIVIERVSKMGLRLILMIFYHLSCCPCTVICFHFHSIGFLGALKTQIL